MKVGGGPHWVPEPQFADLWLKNRTEFYTVRIIIFNEVEILIFFDLNNDMLLIIQSTRCHENVYFSDARYVILKLARMLCQIN